MILSTIINKTKTAKNRPGPARPGFINSVVGGKKDCKLKL